MPDLINDDHALRIYGTMLDRMLNDPAQRALIEQWLGIAPAVETSAVPVVDPDTDVVVKPVSE